MTGRQHFILIFTNIFPSGYPLNVHLFSSSSYKCTCCTIVQGSGHPWSSDSGAGDLTVADGPCVLLSDVSLSEVASSVAGYLNNFRLMSNFNICIYAYYLISNF
jgi:hypothetical protein